MKKRYGVTGGHWNSKKYLRLHNQNISRGLKEYHAQKKNTGGKSYAWVLYLLLLLWVAFWSCPYLYK